MRGALVTGVVLVLSVACVRRPIENPNIIVMGMTSGPNSLDARLGSADTSQKLGQLIYRLGRATVSTDDTERRRLFGDVQKLLAREVPYISLWDKTNYAVAQRTLSGIQLKPAADLLFLKDVSRTAFDRHAGN